MEIISTLLNFNVLQHRLGKLIDGDYLLHGSKYHDLEILLPHYSFNKLYRGKNINALYATNDIITAAFYAVFDKRKGRGSSVFEKLTTEEGIKYRFNIEKSIVESSPFHSGYIYIVKKRNFSCIENDNYQSRTWCSLNPVVPLAKIEVNYKDFLSQANLTFQGALFCYEFQINYERTDFW